MNHLTELIKTLHILDVHQLTPLVPLVRDCRMRGGTLWLAGNGGSYATALHWACDLHKVCAVRTQVLGANGASLTAWSNDDGYAEALSDELARSARLNDCLICLSCSGGSPNIMQALRFARRMVSPGRFPSALLTSIHCTDDTHADHTIRVPSRNYGVIEDCFGAIGHWLTKELAS